MKALVFLRWTLRESRGARGRLVYFAACLAAGVAAVVGAAALTRTVEGGVQQKSREILGADLSFSARRPLPPELDEALAKIDGIERTDVVETPTMVAVPGADGRPARSRLAQLRAVRGRYPLHGAVETQPPGGLAPLLSAETVVAAEDLAAALGVRAGDSIVVGGVTFRLAGTVAKDPDRMGFSSFLGPRIYLSQEGFERARLSGFGMRVRHERLVAVPGDPSRQELVDLRDRVVASVPAGGTIEAQTHFASQPQGRRSIERLEKFVGLAALLSIVVGGIGVAQIVRATLASRTQAVAVLRCIGLLPREIAALMIGHAALVGLFGSVAGAAAGCLLPWLVDATVPDVLAGASPLLPTPASVLRGIALGTGLAVLFSLAPLSAVWRVSPARVLRADAAPLPPPWFVIVASGAAVLAGVLGAAWVQSGSTRLAVWFTAGFAGLLLALAAASRAAMALAGRLPRAGMNAYVRHGLAALARPGAGTTGAVAALGLGSMVAAGAWIVGDRLVDAMLREIPSDAPSAFLVDIRPDQWDGVRRVLDESGAEGIDQVPVMMARISAIDGGSPPPGSRAQGRENRLTTRRTLSDDNRIVEGALWSDPARPEVSVEEGFARDIGARLGSTIAFDVQGVPVELTVTSLREVEWRSLSINFFLVVEPGVLEDATSYVLASARLPPDREQGLQDRLAGEYPGVSVVRVRAIVEQVRDLVGRLAVGIRVLGAFVAAAAVAVLAGAVSAGALHRRREIALLKTLGVTRGGCTALLAVEYAMLGAVAGAVGAGGALLLAEGFLGYVVNLRADLPWAAVPVTSAACAAATALSALGAGYRALAVRPLEALR